MYGPKLSLYNAIDKISEKIDETNNQCNGLCDEGQCLDNIYCQFVKSKNKTKQYLQRDGTILVQSFQWK